MEESSRRFADAVAAFCGLLGTAYDQLAGKIMPDMWLIDLFSGLRALLNYKVWLIGCRDAGLSLVTKDLARERIREFLRRALASAPKRALKL